MGVGAATWIAHLYAELVGDHLRHGTGLDRTESRGPRRMAFPSFLPPFHRRSCCFSDDSRFSMKRVRCGQLSSSLSSSSSGSGPMSDQFGFVGSHAWTFAAATAAIGVGVVTMKLVLGH